MKILPKNLSYIIMFFAMSCTSCTSLNEEPLQNDVVGIKEMLNYMRWGWHGEGDGWYAEKELTNNLSLIDMKFISVYEDKD